MSLKKSIQDLRAIKEGSHSFHDSLLEEDPGLTVWAPLEESRQKRVRGVFKTFLWLDFFRLGQDHENQG